MSLVITHEAIPLKATEDGVVRVGGTRVTLDTVVAAFEEGATAEEIVQQYPTLRLADTYAAIGYYLSHRAEIEAYLERRRQDANEARRKNMARRGDADLRARLLARRAK